MKKNDMINITDDLALLTSIPSPILKKIESDAFLCIAEGLHEALLSNNNVVSFDIGYGILTITCENEQLKYKFIPSAKLNDIVIKTVKNSENPFIKTVNEALVSKLTLLYKDLL